QLQRILEMTGMSTHAKDFSTQSTFTGEDKNIRPDVIVSLPGNRCVIIDSKVPLSAYLDSVQTNDDNARGDAIKQHARHLKDHIKTLSSKAYWNKIEGTPEFVVLFLPGEHFLSAALDSDNDLMEYSAKNQVVLATPMTLIALLRTVSFGWRQEALQENARQISDLGGKLFGALSKFSAHFGKVGSRLSSAVDAYNSSVGSLDRNVLVKSRKLAECGVASGETEIETPALIEKEPRLTLVGTETPKIAKTKE
ncbi:MAG TPA: DNA recombination protein RmuC, partial [Rhodospirillaceae bacterium]|nr:DNA recombination protein RmuC [Rhodospirillaceae bacterium]